MSLCNSFFIIYISRKDTGILDAATKGALAAIPLVLNITANLIAFVSFIAFCDNVIEWSADLVGYQGLNLRVIKSFFPKIFY